jgi:hypothetical protein
MLLVTPVGITLTTVTNGVINGRTGCTGHAAALGPVERDLGAHVGGLQRRHLEPQGPADQFANVVESALDGNLILCSRRGSGRWLGMDQREAA